MYNYTSTVPTFFSKLGNKGAIPGVFGRWGEWSFIIESWGGLAIIFSELRSKLLISGSRTLFLTSFLDSGRGEGAAVPPRLAPTPPTPSTCINITFPFGSFSQN